MAEQVEAACLVAFTTSGATARLASKCRPRVPLLAATPSPATARRCNLLWGVLPVLLPTCRDTDEMLRAVEKPVKATGMARTGDTVVDLARSRPGQTGTTNLIKLLVLG